MYSKQLAGYAAEFKYKNLSEEVIDMAKRCIMDYIGVAIGGHNKTPSLIWDKLIARRHSRNEATILKPGYPETNYLYAAGINAAYGHALDMDDLHNASIVHPAVVTIPTALAIGQNLRKSGKEVIRAIVAGYEVGIRIGEAINPASYWYWHTTSIVGNFASAATAGVLMELNHEQMNHCFGSAGSQASGLWEFMTDGAMTKTLHVARATMNGILSAELASLGFTGASRILEGHQGLIRAIAPKYDLEKLVSDFAKPYKIMENSFKPYACCRHTHSANYAIEKIVKKHRLKAEDVESIIDRTYQVALDITDNPRPNTIYAHKFSLQYCIAACLVYGDLLDDKFTEEKINNPLVQETMKKVTVKLDREINDIFNKNPDKWIHDLEIKTTDGRLIRERVEYPLGDVNNPLDWAMLEKKFYMLLEEHLTNEEINKLIDRIYNLEDMEDINQLFSI